MEWQAPALLLSVRSHGETSAIVDVLSRDHGRFSGLVRGGTSRKQKPILQIGNLVDAHWRARLAEHLGVMVLEPIEANAAKHMNNASSLAALVCLCEWLRILPERQAFPRLFDTAQIILDHLADAEVWPALFVRFEVALLEEIGFGLDLSHCAATGVVHNLNYISPRSGRAVCEEAAAQYLDKLFPLPPFLKSSDAQASPQDVIDGFALTQHFLERRVLHPNGKNIPETRERMLSALNRFLS
jgi:DNA repair protein RecO (recombination protein O)